VEKGNCGGGETGAGVSVAESFLGVIADGRVVGILGGAGAGAGEDKCVAGHAGRDSDNLCVGNVANKGDERKTNKLIMTIYCVAKVSAASIISTRFFAWRLMESIHARRPRAPAPRSGYSRSRV
jgi:hypothetical protein